MAYDCMSQSTTAARVAAAKAGRAYVPRKRVRKQVNTRPTLWEHGEFVAVDGEGFSDGEPFEYFVGADQTHYVGRNHSYAYLAASDGSELYRDRLGLADCLEFLCAIVERNPLAILVAFGASYDVTHFVCHDLDRDDLHRLVGKHEDGRPCVVTRGGWTYVLDYRPRKCLTIQRWPEGARRWQLNEKTGKREATPHLTARLWDVWGFFQDSFVGVMTKWVPGDPDFEFIRRMKGDRSIFERSEIEDIKRYNAAELRILVKVMNRVRDAINDLGLKITRWDGAGAVAAAMMTKHKVKVHKRETDGEIFEAARRAYSGGHIEACKLGTWRNRVYHYDINSAYPDQFRKLPSLNLGKWINRNLQYDYRQSALFEPPDGYTLVKVDFAFPDGLPFYPLFYRQEDGSIFYPPSGVGWYWWSEYDVARRLWEKCRRDYPDAELRWQVKAWFHFKQEDGAERPFQWVEDYYAKRQHYISTARAGGFESGPEKIIKLGLNSLYGKTAQQVGARVDKEGELRLPPFFQLDWAGFVTAGCRARMMEAALQKPHAVIMFATDGLFTTEPLDLYCPAEKELGAWEAQEHDGITVVMPGVYWLHENTPLGAKTKHYSRGFDKGEMRDCQFVIDAWRRGADSVSVSLTRLVGIGSACSSADLWKMRGCFAESTRRLSLDGDNSKRYGAPPRSRPDRELVPLEPRSHFLPNKLGVAESAPYPISWLDGTPPPRDDADMLEWLDEIDAELA